jgi:carnitine 3-dehydrogenase
MTRFETPRVAVVGAGEIGRGWAALAVAAGWPVTIYDADSEKLAPAADAVADRVVNLVKLRRAQAAVAEEALNVLQVGRSLLNAVAEADWIIEAVPDDLAIKQKALQHCEQVARRAAILTSSSNSLPPSLLGARLDRPERFIVTHPLAPVDLIPLVELVPGPKTDAVVIEDIRFWLSMMGRAAIVFKKDVEDVDRAVSIGPALAWAATGPHLDHQLGSGELGVDVVLPRMLGEYEEIWKSLADWKHLPTEEQNRLVKMLDKAYAPHLTELREARDIRLARLLEALRE